MLELITLATLEELQETEEIRNIDKKIFNDETKINEENFELISKIFNETAEEYFKLGFKTGLSLIADCR